MKRKICSATLLIILIIIGLFKSGIALFDYNGKTEGKFYATVYSIGKESKYMKSYVAKIGKQYFLLYVKKDSYNIEIGDTIEFKGIFSSAEHQKNYRGFNYNLYLKTKKISGIFKAEKVTKIKKSINLYIKVKKKIYNIKMDIIELLEEKLKKENSALLSGILIGEDNKISTEDMENFNKLSLTHMLAISGENFMYIILLFDVANKRIRLKRIGYYATILGILFFMELTGNSASVIRAGLMCILSILSKILHRKYDIWTSLAISVLFQIIYNPYSIFDIGLQLSYVGVVGIVGLYKKINKKVKSGILCGIISSNIILLPISIYYFNELSLLFIISNFFASIIIELLTILGFLSLFIRSSIIFSILDCIISIFRSLASVFSSIPFSSINVTTPTITSIIVYYLLILKMFHKKKNNKYNKTFLCVAVSTILVLNVNYITIDSIINQKLFINFVDVGQGDCTLIRYKNKTILVDGGGNAEEDYDIGKKVLIPYLLDRKIKKIDYVIISHFDSDHVGGIISVINELKVNKIITSSQFENSENYTKIKKLSNEKKIPIIVLDANDKNNKLFKQTIQIERDLYIDFLWPNKEFAVKENVLNNNSIVCKLRYKNFSFLFTGDIEEIAEKQIIKNYNKGELESMILKVGHHGSNTSSSQDFISLVKPKIALIGVGKDNKFGHPNEKVIERLEKINCKIYRTDLMGEISIEVDKKGNIKTKNKIALQKK